MTPAFTNSRFRIFIIVLALVFGAAACSPGHQGKDNSIKISKINGVTVNVIETTPEATSEPEATSDPEATPEAGDDTGTLIAIEGPVAAINGNIITVFNFNIQVQENDPILLNLHLDDIIHAEGTSLLMGDTIIIVAINIVIIEIEIDGPIIIYQTNPNACHVNKSGKVKCSKKRRS
jgi:hypothetical protein